MTTRFSSECLEDIFSHLCGRYLLYCTEVCPEWNNFIGSTRSCMEKIELIYSCGYKDEWEVKRVLMFSKRKYECLSLSGEYYEEMQKYLSAKGRMWKQVTMNLFFATNHHFFDFLKILNETAQKLVFQSGKVKEDFNSSFGYTDLHFP